MARAQAEHTPLDIHAAYLPGLGLSQVWVLAHTTYLFPRQCQAQFKDSRRQGQLHYRV